MCVKLEQKFKFQQCAKSAQSRHMCCSRSTQSIPGHKKYIIDIDDRNSFLQSLQKTRKNRRLNWSLGEKIFIKMKLYIPSETEKLILVVGPPFAYNAWNVKIGVHYLNFVKI